MSVEPDAYALAVKLEARADLYFFTRYMFKQMRGFTWLDNWHHRLICDALIRVFRGETKRLIITLPPRYSKTELAVVNFIAWSLGLAPDAEFIHVSYGAKLADNNAGAAKRIVQHPAYRMLFPEVTIRRDSNAKGEWRTTAGGVVYAQGEGGAITGFGAGKLRPGFGGAILIDDIHKASEARSDVKREGVVDWFNNTLESRTNDPANTPIIAIGQRLHEKDLLGWLLAGGNGEVWEHLNIPAIQPDGTALWSAKHTIETLRRMQAVKPYDFAGQYMQEPSPREGGMFSRRMFEVVKAAPISSRKVRKWDLAATEEAQGTDPDWTVGTLMSRAPNGLWYVEDVVRFRGSPREVELGILNTASRDGTGVTIHLSQDPGAAGKAHVAYLKRLLASYTVKSEVETGSKEVRAAPLSSQAEAGNIKVVEAAWNEAWFAELEMFPNGAHDDQVDSAAGAFGELEDGATTQAWADWMEGRANALLRPQVPSHLVQYLRYIHSTGHDPLNADWFDDDWMPIGPQVRGELQREDLIETVAGGLRLTDLAKLALGLNELEPANG